MSDQDAPASAKKRREDEKARRLAEALRSNLGRRKSQARERAAEAADEAPDEAPGPMPKTEQE